VIRIRRALDDIPDYVPGRSAEAVAAEHALVEAIKLASNEVSLPPLPAIQAAIASAAATANRYPDDGATALREAIASRYDVAPAHVLLGAGSVAICQQAMLATCDPGDEVVWCWPSFEAYPILARHADASIRAIPLRDHRYDVDAMLEALTERTRVVFLCNPNNPTGTVVSHADVARLLDGVPADCLVALDEAYREFVTTTDTPDGLELLSSHPNLVVLRTFSKAYGLAGLRVGYAIGAPDVIAALRKVRHPFGVSTIAQVAALAALAAEAEVRARVEGVVAQRDRVTAALRSFGVDVPDSEANFVWLPLGASAAAVGTACEEQGVGLRAFPGVGVRATIGTPEENDRMLAALQRALSPPAHFR
jgi:histidinol-phosphate aminotransferase